VQAQWLHHLNEAVKVTPESIKLLTTDQLNHRCQMCGGHTASAAHSAMGVEIGRPTTGGQRAELERLFTEHCAARDHSVVETPRPDDPPPPKSIKDHGKASSILDGMRRLVSKEKQRFQEGGFDLDLTYITPRIIAMGFPSSGIEGAYRNPVEEVQRFFAKFHPDNRWRTYNLCEERVYEGHALGGEEHPGCCRHFPFDDHNPCPFELLPRICEAIHAWLGADERHVAAVHCKAGKGRTGLMVSCLLVYLRVVGSADEALRFFADKRTHDGKGVTIPSQMRYVRTYAHLFAATEGGATDRAGDSDDVACEDTFPRRERGREPLVLTRTIEDVPVIRLVALRMVYAPSCVPYVIVRSVHMLGRADFGEREANNPRILESTVVTQAAAAARKRVPPAASHAHLTRLRFPAAAAHGEDLRLAPAAGRRQAAGRLRAEPRRARRRLGAAARRGARRHAAHSAGTARPLPPRRRSARAPPHARAARLGAQGDLKITCYESASLGKDRVLWSCWVHTRFLRQHPVLVLHRKDLDSACKSKDKEKWPDNFAVEIESGASCARRAHLVSPPLRVRAATLHPARLPPAELHEVAYRRGAATVNAIDMGELLRDLSLRSSGGLEGVHDDEDEDEDEDEGEDEDDGEEVR